MNENLSFRNSENIHRIHEDISHYSHSKKVIRYDRSILVSELLLVKDNLRFLTNVHFGDLDDMSDLLQWLYSRLYACIDVFFFFYFYM